MSIYPTDANLKGIGPDGKPVGVGVGPSGKLKVEDTASLSTAERLSAIENTLRVLLLHAEAITKEQFTIDDIIIEGEV